MSAPDLMAEYAAAIEASSNRHVKALEALGVPPEISSGILPDHPMLGVARVVTHGDLYEPHSTGQPHYLCPVLHENGGWIEDLIAWAPHAPDQWWARTGNGVLLNPELPSRVAMAADWGEDERLLINESSLSWLRARCKGVVVLDWQRCIPFHLSTVHTIECETEELAARLYGAYAINDRPAIFTNEEIHEAA